MLILINKVLVYVQCPNGDIHESKVIAAEESSDNCWRKSENYLVA